MRTILRIRDVIKDWNGTSLFENVSMDVTEGERLALFGRNGAGKTTLLRILLGDEAPTSGKLEHELPLEERGWMKQQDTIQSARTALEAAQQASPEHWRVKTTLKQLEAEIAHRGEEAERRLEQYGELMDEYERLQGFAWESEVEKALTRMGMPAETWPISYGDLSGGQKTRVRLAGLMVRQPKLLVLDEPTNHLDAESLLWLEQWLSTYHGTLLFVSHDRAFLDRVATGICELTSTGIRRYKGGYTEYKEQKERELREQEANYRKQELARQALEETIRSYREWFHQAHRAASNVEMAVTQSFYKAKANKNISRYHAKEKELERLEANRVEQPREAASLHMKLSDSRFQAKYLLRAEHVYFSYDDHNTIVQDLNLNIARGDRLAVRGSNGIGKTTLLRLLTGQLEPYKGKITANPQLKIGYFSQELEQLPKDQTLLDSLLALPTMTQTEARTVLGCFLFAREDVFKRIGTLSMGEKCRVAFLRLYFSGANLLVLDEPTNYFDIETREIVEESLRSYDGALVLVSHDRELVRRTATRLLDMQPGGTYEIYEGTADEKQEEQRNRQQEPEDQEQREERLRLQLRLTELMGTTGPDDENEELLSEIRRIRAKLDQSD